MVRMVRTRAKTRTRTDIRGTTARIRTRTKIRGTRARTRTRTEIGRQEQEQGQR